MKIYAVVSTSPSWMNGGYGHSLLAADHPDLLVSFEEFSKKPEQQLAVVSMGESYVPRLKIMLKPTCDMGVGCDESGMCYAEQMGEPDRCGRLP